MTYLDFKQVYLLNMLVDVISNEEKYPVLAYNVKCLFKKFNISCNNKDVMLNYIQKCVLDNSINFYVSLHSVLTLKNKSQKEVVSIYAKNKHIFYCPALVVYKNNICSFLYSKLEPKTFKERMWNKLMYYLFVKKGIQ